MDASTKISAGTSTTVTSVGSDSFCVQLCQQEPRRMLLILSLPSTDAKVQPVPPGDTLNVNVALTRGINLFAATNFGGTIVLNLADHGPLVQMAWFADMTLSLTPPTWTVVEVIDLQLPCKVNAPVPQDNLLEGLSGGRGAEENFSWGLGVN